MVGPMKITLTSVMVDDQEKALNFYTDVLGFVKKTDVPAGDYRWITVVSEQQMEGPELALEPMGFEPARDFQKALYDAGIPWTAFQVEDVDAEYKRLSSKAVEFSMEPKAMDSVKVAVFDDTCGNNIQIYQEL